MSDKIILVNPVTGKSKSIKVGVSWPVFFFGSCLGIPFFVKGLNILGAAFFFVRLLDFLPLDDIYQIIADLGILIAGGVLAFRANADEARNKISNGWRIAENQDPTLVAEVMFKWKLHEVKKKKVWDIRPTDWKELIGLTALAVALLVKFGPLLLTGLTEQYDSFIQAFRSEALAVAHQRTEEAKEAREVSGSKHDIRGFYPGQTEAQARAHEKDLNSPCRGATWIGGEITVCDKDGSELAVAIKEEIVTRVQFNWRLDADKVQDAIQAIANQYGTDLKPDRLGNCFHVVLNRRYALKIDLAVDILGRASGLDLDLQEAGAAPAL